MDKYFETQTKPLIAVSCDADDDPEKMELRSTYLYALRAAGAHPVPLPILPDTKEIKRMAALVDGFVFTGGDDLHPKYYGGTPTDDVSLNSEKRERTDLQYVEAALDTGKPVLGLCYGMQLMNVVKGGSLYQDINRDVDRDVLTHKLPDQLTAHKVTIDPQSMLSEIFLGQQITVNSSHHQAVRSLGNGLESVAVSADGIIEGFEATNRDVFHVGIQWHPERMISSSAQGGKKQSVEAEKNAMNLFEYFVDSCKEY